MAIADKWDRYVLVNPINTEPQNLIHITPIAPPADKGSNALIYPVQEIAGNWIMGNPITTPDKYDNVINTPRPEIKGPSVMMQANNIANSQSGSNTLNASQVRDMVKNATEQFNSQAFNIKTEAELGTLYQKITNGASPHELKNYNGISHILNDKTIVGLRNESSTGGKTIDVFPKAGKPYKVHIKPGD